MVYCATTNVQNKFMIADVLLKLLYNMEREPTVKEGQSHSSFASNSSRNSKPSEKQLIISVLLIKI